MPNRGYFTIAQGALYQRLAYGLALSLKLTQPKELSRLSIGVTSEELTQVNPKYREVFHEIIEIPWGDHALNHIRKVSNEWKSIYMTPYDETIKLDADMLFPADVSFWWDYLSESDGTFVTQPVTYRGEIIEDNFYRQVFIENKLPNIYTAFFYFKKNDVNFELFKLVEFMFNNWEACYSKFLSPKFRPKHPDTDIIFSLATKTLAYQVSDPALVKLKLPTFVHMKARLQQWPNDQFLIDDWTKMINAYFIDGGMLKIGSYMQSYPVHYIVKNFLTDDMIKDMEKQLGI